MNNISLDYPLRIPADNFEDAIEQARRLLDLYDGKDSQTWYLTILGVEFSTNTNFKNIYVFDRRVIR